MAVVTHVGFKLSPRSASGARPPAVHPARPARRRVLVPNDGRRPARLAAAPFRPAAQQCEPRTIPGSIGWLVLVGVLAFVVVLAIGWTMGGHAAATVPARTVTVQVHQGETLWTVAERLAPSAAPAEAVAKIRQLNGLDIDSVIYPGELLQVPTALSAADAAKAGALQR